MGVPPGLCANQRDTSDGNPRTASLHRRGPDVQGTCGNVFASTVLYAGANRGHVATLGGLVRDRIAGVSEYVHQKLQ